MLIAVGSPESWAFKSGSRLGVAARPQDLTSGSGRSYLIYANGTLSGPPTFVRLDSPEPHRIRTMSDSFEMKRVCLESQFATGTFGYVCRIRRGLVLERLEGNHSSITLRAPYDPDRAPRAGHENYVLEFRDSCWKLMRNANSLNKYCAVTPPSTIDDDNANDDNDDDFEGPVYRFTAEEWKRLGRLDRNR